MRAHQHVAAAVAMIAVRHRVANVANQGSQELSGLCVLCVAWSCWRRRKSRSRAVVLAHWTCHLRARLSKAPTRRCESCHNASSGLGISSVTVGNSGAGIGPLNTKVSVLRVHPGQI